MNLKDINKILEQINNNSKNSFSVQDLLSLGQHFNESNLADENQLRALIQHLSSTVGKSVSEQQIQQIIDMVKKNKENIKDPNRSANMFKNF